MLDVWFEVCDGKDDLIGNELLTANWESKHEYKEDGPQPKAGEGGGEERKIILHGCIRLSLRASAATAPSFGTIGETS